MKKYPINQTLINLLWKVDKERVVDVLHDYYNPKLDYEIDDHQRSGYLKVIYDLLHTPFIREMDLYLDEISEDYGDKKKSQTYIDVTFINPNFVKDSPKNKKVWGGKEDKEFDVPDVEKYYNLNWSGYSRVFSCSLTDWPEFLGAYIYLSENTKNMSYEEICAHIIWELTFYGFSREDIQKECKVLEDIIKELDLERNKKCKKIL